MTPKAAFFMDAGAPIVLRREDNSQFEVERYAAWGRSGRGKMEVIEVSNDLEGLRAKYGQLRVVDMKGNPIQSSHEQGKDTA